MTSSDKTAKSGENYAFEVAKKIGDEYAPEPLYQAVRKSILVCRQYPSKFYREKIVFPLYQKGLKNFDSLYTENYYRKRIVEDEKVKFAEEFSQVIIDTLDPDSVLDVGCAVGHFLKPLRDQDVTVQGVDAHSSCKELSVIPSELIDLQDLTEGYTPGRNFEVVMCLETLEHIPESAEDVVVEMIAGSADEYIVVSAAPPRQPGTHHVNLKPESYWIEKFEAYGVCFDKDLTDNFKDSISREDVRLRNLLIFKSQAEQGEEL